MVWCCPPTSDVPDGFLVMDVPDGFLVMDVPEGFLVIDAPEGFLVIDWGVGTPAMYGCILFPIPIAVWLDLGGAFADGPLSDTSVSRLVRLTD